MDRIRVQDRKLSREQVRKIAEQLLKAADFMENQNIMYNDLKLDNILLRNSASRVDSDGYGSLVDSVVSVVDFGLASSIDNYRPEHWTNGAHSTKAPEKLLRLTAPDWVGFPSELWSIGCVVFELYFGRPLVTLELVWEPFDILKGIEAFTQQQVPPDMEEEARTKLDEDATVTFLENRFEAMGVAWGRLSTMDEMLPPEGPQADVLFRDFLNVLLQVHPQHRGTASEALTHPYITRRSSSEIHAIAPQVCGAESLPRSGRTQGKSANPKSQVDQVTTVKLRRDGDVKPQPSPSKPQKKEKREFRRTIRTFAPNPISQEELIAWAQDITDAATDNLKKGQGAAAVRLHHIVKRLTEAGGMISNDQINSEDIGLRQALSRLYKSTSDFREDAGRIYNELLADKGMWKKLK